MFRTMVLSGVTAMGLVFVSGSANTADAGGLRIQIGGEKVALGIGIGNSYRGRHDHCEHYTVIYRDCSHGRWQVYGTYESHRRAHDVARGLEYRGYDATVRHDR